MSFPTVSQSKFAQPEWQEHFRPTDHTNFEMRGNSSAAEVLAKTDTRDVISPAERLRVLADALPSMRSKRASVTGTSGAGDATVSESVEPARVARLDPELKEEAPRVAASVFTALTQQAVRMAECPFAKRDEEMARNHGRLSGKSNSEGVARTWSDGEVRAARLVRESVQVTLPNGEARTYSCVREAFACLLLDVKKHIRFRIRLKEEREFVYTESGASYMFKLVPRLNRRK